ncbi:WD40-repeat-containing domain protein [Apodospora peruviana]|uniref:WD40-repeat-containing domain protein n=1 Tax=Apodospora peruviana TaxID=516989 RepID=A0AAE0ITL1_9PEZI|nr:WD40-repeat-containing domain protein [Apodospora peruviana]
MSARRMRADDRARLSGDGDDEQESVEDLAPFPQELADAVRQYHAAPDEDEDDDQEYVDEVDDEDVEDEDDDDDEFMDAESGEIELEVMFEEMRGEDAQDGNNDDDDDDADGQHTLHRRILRLISGQNGPAFLTQHQILALLRGQDPRQALFDDDDDDDYNPWSSRRRRPEPPLDPNRFPKVPSEEGRKLMESGFFGAFDSREPDTKRLARRILDRELGLGGGSGLKTNQGMMAQQMIPSTNPEMIIHYDDPVCCGQFSDDGNFFYACVKDYRVRLYDTSNPYNWRHYKTVTYPFGQWTLTDAALSPDNKWLAFSSLQSSVCFAPTDPNDTGDPYSLELGNTGMQTGWRHGSFAIYSVKFSGDGRNIVAGTGDDSIVVYDIERRQSVHKVNGHDDDVNAVCFADRLSPHILYSGSDDCTIKVWDTRSMGDGREAGAFVGHVEGITYIDSKGDGRYILSNGKDQSMKLWDLRMAMSTSKYEESDASRVTRTRRHVYDYRMGPYNERRWFKHPHDNSLVTFRGHRVQRTLIRCHFSPPGSSNSRYVYSGSYDGLVYVWNMDATIAARIDVKSATEGLRPSLNSRYRVHRYYDRGDEWVTLVRDVGWHPNAPLLVASAWNGPGADDAGTASLHSFNENEADEAEPGMGLSVDEKLSAVSFA